MNPVLAAGTRVVVLALLSYTAAMFFEQKKRLISKPVLIFQSLGLALDITATTMMIIGSRNTPFTVHGIFGYSALAAMIVKTFLFLRFHLKNGPKRKIIRSIHLYSWTAYAWWLFAFILGSLLVFFS